MNREIIFKAKRVDNGEWVEGDLIHGVGNKADKMFILPVKTNLAYLDGCDPLDGYSVIPETVCQYTGLKDKNGRMIWEGDLLNVPSEDYEYCRVEWNEKTACFQINGYGKSMYHNEGGGEEYSNDTSLIEEHCMLFGEEYIEITGNIHD